MTNKEIAEMAWERIRTDLEFEDWYKECWGECMEEAARLIDCGACKWESGSFFEVSRTISKDGQTYNYDVDQENFVEYFGKEECMARFCSIRLRNLLTDEVVLVHESTEVPESSYGIPCWVDDEGTVYGQVGLPMLGYEFVENEE